MEAFLIGLAFGAAGALAVLIWQWNIRRNMKRDNNAEIARLKSLLADRMDIESDGVKKLKAENEELKHANENLRITVAALSQKPGRAEAQQLMVYKQALEKLFVISPGFGGAWQTALNESEAEFERAYSGSKALWKRLVPGKIPEDGKG